MVVQKKKGRKKGDFFAKQMFKNNKRIDQTQAILDLNSFFFFFFFFLFLRGSKE